MFTLPAPDYKTRLTIISTGIVLLIWSGFEDNQVWGVALLGWLLAIQGVILLIMSRFGGQSIHHSTLTRVSPLIGASIGASASIFTALLMLFKDIRHAHIFPDYPPQIILAILERLPIWTISGGFIGLGIGLLWYFASSIPPLSDDKGGKLPAD